MGHPDVGIASYRDVGHPPEDVELLLNAGTFEGVLEELLCFDGSEVRVAFVTAEDNEVGVALDLVAD